MNPNVSPSIRIFKPRSTARLRLYCFPYSGGSAQSFNGWEDRLPSFVELCAIQLPGRGGRYREPRYTRVDAAIKGLLPEMLAHIDKPFALYGHSLGAAMAFEMGRALQAQNLQPQLVVPSGMMGPRQPSLEPPTYHLPDPEFRQKLKEFNGTPREILEHEELMELVLPVLKADFTMADTYAYEEGPLLTCPMVAMAGIDDPHTNDEGMRDWANYTTGSFNQYMFQGDHFFINQYADEVLATLSQILGHL